MVPQEGHAIFIGSLPRRREQQAGCWRVHGTMQCIAIQRNAKHFDLILVSVAARLGTSLGDQQVQARRLLRDAIYRLGRGSWDRC